MNTTLRRGVLGALLACALFTSCIGPFNATRRLHIWNREIQTETNRWLGEGVFLVLRLLPVYSIFLVSDLFIWNSIQFWGWENPITPVNSERRQALRDADDARAAAARAEDEAEEAAHAEDGHHDDGDGEGEHHDGGEGEHDGA